MIGIVATLGPASGTEAAVWALRDAGATKVRLNASHISLDTLIEFWIPLATKCGFSPSQIVVDLQGGKTRIGWMPKDIALVPGAVVKLEGGDQTWPAVPIDRPTFLRTVKPGDVLRIDDGRVELTIVDINPVMARADEASVLRSRAGVTLADGAVTMPTDLTPREERLLEYVVEAGVRDIAVSYANPRLVESVRERGAPRIIAKLEQPAAIDALDDLCALSDALWLCRGDLGAEAGIERLPALQRRALADATKPPGIAGEVLQHLVFEPRPTRAEVCHAADLMEKGIAGFVLSDETAIGKNGPAAVAVLQRLQGTPPAVPVRLLGARTLR